MVDLEERVEAHAVRLCRIGGVQSLVPDVKLQLGACGRVQSSGFRVQCPRFRCQANMARVRQSIPDCGLGFQVKGFIGSGVGFRVQRLVPHVQL